MMYLEEDQSSDIEVQRNVRDGLMKHTEVYYDKIGDD